MFFPISTTSDLKRVLPGIEFSANEEIIAERLILKNIAIDGVQVE